MNVQVMGVIDDETKKQTHKNAPDDDLHRYSGDGSAMGLDHSLDHKRTLVAFPHLAWRGYFVGNLRLCLLFQARGVYLSRMP